ncbi:magnesium/cobalt transporter CorA [Brevundimonas sp. 2R-24]|uniref:Magnesium transport protein CorA n=1 Tax=Peiella sedimenti TaxID=3061083 RepID=A0ABT8SQS2_9CAUL|nr:magnesium/cobalt transporter CorA [Caulobacteraceae bacterium XZ-24]
MSLVAAAVYRQGQRVRTLTLDDDIALGDDEFVWIGLVEPTEGELRTLQARFRLHPLAVEDALKAHQLPKAEVFGDQLFVVLRTAHFQPGGLIDYGETAVFMGQGFIITVRHGSTRAHTQLREQLEAAPSLLRHGIDYVLHAVLDFIVDGYLPVVEAIEAEVDEMERRALDAFLGRAEVTRIFALRREVRRFQRLLDPTNEVCARLEHLELPCVDAEVRPYFRDVGDHVRRVEAMLEALSEVLASVFEASLLLEQQRQGAITRRLAAWAAILAVPTAIAGVYGMNFEIMPELEWRYGYFAVLALIGAVCLYLYARFKRSGWL